MRFVLPDALLLDAMLSPDTRLQALAAFNILDTPPEPEFDDIARLAQRLCGTKVALVSLVAADRQWFKANIGFPARETDLDRSVCKHALSADGLLVIPDLAVDPRTRANPLVTGAPRIRFYAGAVLRTPEGVAVGSLCVIDDAPRPGGLTGEQQSDLLALGRQIMVLLALRRAMADRDRALAAEAARADALREVAELSEARRTRLEALETRQRQAQEAGGIGTFDLDVATDTCTVSAEFCRIFGLPRQAEFPLADIAAMVAAEDRSEITTPAARRDGTARLDVEFRIRRASDGALRSINRRAEFRTGSDGEVRSMIGVVQDVTARKLMDSRAKALVGLGDALRDARSVAEAMSTAAAVLGATLDASRAGYARIDVEAGAFTIEGDWTAPGTTSIAGTHAIAHFAASIRRLEHGAPVATANVPATAWLASDHARLESIGIRSFLDIPLLIQGRLTGVLFVHGARPRTWTAQETDFAHAVADRTYAAIAKLEAEAHQRVLNAELSHRLKNTLAMVQAINNQTLRGVADRAVVAALEQRIIALSKAHDLLLGEGGAAAHIRTVVANALDPHGGAVNFRVSGPDISVGAKATMSITLLLHELATNAAKYGALSAEGGRVELEWRVSRYAGAPRLLMAWTERGGPPAFAPARRGFGSRLIALGIVGAGRTELDFTAHGLHATFSAPLDAVQES